MNQPDFAPGTHENTGEISMDNKLNALLNKIAELKVSNTEMLGALKAAKGFLPIGGSIWEIALRAIDHAEKLQRGS